jgi:Replication protein
MAPYRDPGDAVKPEGTPLNRGRRVKGHVPRTKAPRERPPDRHNNYRERLADPVETSFRHANWQQKRDRVREALLAACTSRTTVDRFDNCGAECLVEWSDEADRYRLRASYCHNRHCEPCAKARAGLIAANLRNKLEAKAAKDGDRFRFITLTLKHSDAPLADQIKRLQQSFTRLRQTAFWKRSQRGGCSMIEVKLTEKGEWHPHLHIIGEGDFLRQETLSREWKKITKDSFRVDVRKIASAKDAVHYVSKYVCKGTNDEVWNDPEKAAEWVVATRGLRTGATYGTWRGFKLLQHDPKDDCKDWRAVALLTDLIRRANEGEQHATILLGVLQDAHQYCPGKPRKHKQE